MKPQIIISDGRAAKHIFKLLRAKYGETGNKDLIVLGKEGNHEDVFIIGDFIKSVYFLDESDNVIEVFDKQRQKNGYRRTDYTKNQLVLKAAMLINIVLLFFVIVLLVLR